MPATSPRRLGRDGSAIRRSVLPGGLRVVTESMPDSRAASVGVWVGVGSVDETRSLAGASHFLEHLLFKATQTRSAWDISSAVEAVGGDINAFTDKEYTCYHALTLAEDLPLAIEVVCDVVTGALIAPADVEGERGVILDELAMRDDDPTDELFDAFGEALFGDVPLGRPVIGSMRGIETLRRDAIARYYRRRYTPSAMVVAAAGRLDHGAVLRLVRRAFAGRLSGPSVTPAVRRGPSGGGLRPVAPLRVLHRQTEQASVVLGCRGLSRTDPRRFAASVLSSALGGGASSRLFQQIRETRGLAYSIHTFSQHFAATGTFGVYAGTAPGKVDEVLSLISAELADVAENGVTDAELRRATGQLRGGLVLGQQDAESRMSRLGKSELCYGDVLSIDEVLTRIEGVDGESVAAVAADLLRRPRCLSVLGPFGDNDFGAP